MAGGVIRLSPARSKTLVGPDAPHLTTDCRGAERDGGHAATPSARSSSTATGSPSAAGAPRGARPARRPGVPTRFLHDCRRTAARNLIRANVPERVAMLLTGHKSRAIFDRYNIIHEQELLDAGDQLVAYLAQQAQAVPASQRPHPAGPATPRTAPPLRLVRRTTA